MFTVQTFLTSKEGESREDCEDSIHPVPGSAVGDGSAGAFAIADGVTTSFFGGLWARMLTERFAECPAAVFEQPWPDWLLRSQEQWQAAVRERAAAETANFYISNDVLSRRPASATFVGMLLDEPGADGAIPWRAQVLGDSCLFILGKDGPRSLPLTKSAEFSNLVHAAESYANDQGFAPQLYGTAPHGSEPPLVEGDTVLLATDALSKWLLLRAETGQPVWGTLLGLTGQAEFEALVEQARREAQQPMENDDVTLGIVRFGTPHAHYSEACFEPQPGPDPPPREPWRPPVLTPSPAPKSPAQRASARLQPGRWRVLLARVNRSSLVAPVLLGLVLTLAVVLIWQAVQQQQQEAKAAELTVRITTESAAADRLRESLEQAQTDALEVKKKFDRVQADLGLAEERFRSVSGKLEAREQEWAKQRRELEVKTGGLDLALKESERKAGMERQILHEAQSQITRLEDAQQTLTANLAAREQELKALREPPEPTPEPPVTEPSAPPPASAPLHTP